MVEFGQSVLLVKFHMDELGVHGLYVCEYEELLDSGVISHISFFLGIGGSPLFGRDAKECDVEEVSFRGVGEGCLGFGNGGWDEVGLNGIGVDAIIEFGKSAVEIP